jgi:hypothetical protein
MWSSFLVQFGALQLTFGSFGSDDVFATGRLHLTLPLDEACV